MEKELKKICKEMFVEGHERARMKTDSDFISQEFERLWELNKKKLIVRLNESN